jgi:sugar O-acyltransferase (sialic acid O-acetyltransferase NeuD family)
MTIPPGACVVIGAGGHARVVLDILLGGDPPVPCVLLDSDASRWGTSMMGAPILGGDDLLPVLVQNGARDFAIGVASAGVPRLRRRLYEAALEAGLRPIAVVHPGASCSKWAEIGRGAQIFAGAIVNAGAALGENVVVNSGAIVEHDCRLGAHVHIATGARLAGGVQVGQGAFVGAGSVIRQGIAIGAEALVGAGAVVIADVAAGTTVVGNPARRLGDTRGETRGSRA